MSDKINPTIVENNGKLIHVLEDGTRKELNNNISIDETRLLPQNPEDGDMVVFDATTTIGGGNDESVKLLIQPVTSENQIVDCAAGNVVPVSLSIEGDITVSEEGIMQFTQSQTISVPMAFSTVEMITGNSEWCLDFEFIPPTDLNDDNEFWSLYNDEQSYVGFWRGSMGDIVHMPCFGDISGFTRGEKHLLTFEQWKDGETWKLSGYRNGSIGKTVETLIPATTSQDISFGHGNKRKFKGQIVSIRFRNIAPYRGVSFQPDETPYTVPQTVGSWNKINKSSFVQSINGNTPDADGNIVVKTSDNGVSIYPATINSETNEITLDNGSDIAQLPVGDEILLEDGVYKKVKEYHTIGSPADGTRIEVSGITNPTESNGAYILTETANVWKHESADYWISQWSGSYWLIANSSAPSNPGMSIFYASGSSSSMPWEMTYWSSMGSASGSPTLVNASTEEHIYNTLDIFEKATFPKFTLDDVGKGLVVRGPEVQEGNDENTFLLLCFDDNVADTSSNNRTDITENSVSYVEGKFGKAVKFAGNSSSYVGIPSTETFPFSGDFTISFWAKASDTSRRGIIAYQNDLRLCIDTNGGVYSIWASSNGSSWDILQADSGYNSELTSDSGRGSIAVKANTWQHIAYVHSGEDWYLFVDGKLSCHKQRSGTVFNANEIFRIGRYGNDNVSAWNGAIDEFKIDTVARWTEEFVPPGHAYGLVSGLRVEYAEIKDESIDHSRLLPDDALNGNIAVFKQTGTIGTGGNNDTVKLLIQPTTSDNQIVDTSIGRIIPATINQGDSNAIVGVNNSGDLLFNGGNNYLSIPSNDVSDVIGSSEWCLDFTITPNWTSGTRKILNLGADGGWYAYLNPQYGTFWFWSKGADSISMGLYGNQTHTITLEQYLDGSTWKLAYYTDGELKHTHNTQVGYSNSDMRFGIGDNNEGGGYVGIMNSIRLRNIAPYRGTNFEPDDLPYKRIQTLGKWESKEVSEVVVPAIEPKLLPDLNTISDKSTGLPIVMVGENNTDDTYILRMPLATDVYDYSLNEVPISNTQVELQPDVPSGEGNSAYFNGSQSYLSGTLPVAFGTGDLTINMWTKISSVNDSCTFFSTRDGDTTSDDAFNFGVDRNGTLAIYSSRTHTSKVSNAESFMFGKWNHLRMIRSSGTLKIYLNGKLHAEGSCTNDWSRTIFTIGTLYRSGTYWDQMKGYIASLEVLNYAMPLEDFEPVFTYGVLTDKKFRVATPSEVKKALWISDVWTVLEDTTDLVLSSKNGNLQKITLSQACTITAPVLDADHPTLLLQATSSNSVMLGDTQIWSSVGTFQIGWYWDGETTRRYGVVEVQ